MWGKCIDLVDSGFLTSCREAEQLGCWEGLTHWQVVIVAVRADRWKDCKAVQEEPGASLEAGREHLLARGNPEQYRDEQAGFKKCS